MLEQVITFYIILYYCSTVGALYTGEVNLDDYGNKVEKIEEEYNKKKKINAVLFFADTAAGEDYTNASGLGYLKLDKKPEIKHCTDYPTSVLSRGRRHWRFKKHTCTCYHRLQEGILALLRYAQNSLGMVTALGSLSNHSFSNSIRFGNSEIHINDGISDEHQVTSLDQTVKTATNNRPESTGQYNEEVRIDKIPNEANTPQLSEKEEEQFRKIPLLNVFPKDSPPPFYAFTDEEERRKRSEGPYVMEPEHTEVFRIRTKRDLPENKPKEISDATYLNSEQKVKAIFDIMDIMTNLQRSLFGTMLQDDSDIFSHDNEACPFQNMYSKNTRQPGLFEVVQKTLYSVINASDTGFLMVIIGGNLSDITSSYSPLVQSIKHVAENTEADSTLIVLTGTCPNSPDAVTKLPCEELNKKNLPLFATGPGSEEFSNCYELYDVPLTVRRILSRYNSNSREAQPQDLEIPMHLRSKRSFAYMDDDDEDYDDDENFRLSPRAARVTGGGGAKDKSSENHKSSGPSHIIMRKWYTFHNYLQFSMPILNFIYVHSVL